jgi:methylated-DNA-[protein]-cysteine S-methyltransferase
MGKIGIAMESIYLTDIFFEYCSDPLENCELIELETKEIKNVFNQIQEYLCGKRKIFDVQIALRGTEFQKKVWNELIKIPYGGTCSYGEIAQRVGVPRGARAVGMANNKNPIPIIIPCHRVIGISGDLIGYGGGLDLKQKLLTLEKKI